MWASKRTALLQHIREHRYDQALKVFDEGDWTVDKVQAAREVISLLCSAEQLSSAAKIVAKCPVELVEGLDLDGVIDSMLRKRRFEMASRAISSFGLVDRYQVEVLHRFFSALVTKGQYRLAVEWARKLAEWEVKSGRELPEYLRWTPTALVSAMIVAEDYDQALKFIAELNLGSELPVEQLIGSMLAHAKYKQALEHIKRFQLEPKYPPLELMNGMLDARQWETAISFANEVPALWNHFPKEMMVSRMAESRDWLAATHYIRQFGIVKTPRDREVPVPQVLTDLIRAMVAAAELHKALKYVLKFELEDLFPPEKLIQQMIDMKQHEHALRFMRMLKLEHLFQDQKQRIHSDRIAQLRFFRALCKRRAENARMRRGGLVGRSGPSNASKDDVVVAEKLWYKYPQETFVTTIPPASEEPELQVKKTTATSFSFPQPPRQDQQQSSFLASLQGGSFSSHNDDGNGDNEDEIVLLGSNASFQLSPENDAVYTPPARNSSSGTNPWSANPIHPPGPSGNLFMPSQSQHSSQVSVQDVDRFFGIVSESSPPRGPVSMHMQQRQPAGMAGFPPPPPQLARAFSSPSYDSSGSSALLSSSSSASIPNPLGQTNVSPLMIPGMQHPLHPMARPPQPGYAPNFPMNPQRPPMQQGLQSSQSEGNWSSISSQIHEAVQRPSPGFGPSDPSKFPPQQLQQQQQVMMMRHQSLPEGYLPTASSSRMNMSNAQGLPHPHQPPPSWFSTPSAGQPRHGDQPTPYAGQGRNGDQSSMESMSQQFSSMGVWQQNETAMQQQQQQLGGAPLMPSQVKRKKKVVK